MAVITTSTFKVFKGISATTYDAQLDVLIPAAQKMVETWCNRVFDTATFTEVHDGDGSRFLVLRNPPIASITSVKILNSEGTATSTYEAASYTVESTTGRLCLATATYGRLVYDDFGILAETQWGVHPFWPNGFQNLQVIYVGGYGSSPAAATMPADLQLAMYQFVDFLLAQTLTTVGSGAMKSEKLGNYSYELNAMAASGQSATQSMMQSLFTPYRRMVL